MKKSTQVLFLSTAFVAISACATKETQQAEKNVEKSIQTEAPATQKGELATRGAVTFMNAPGLTDAQKSKLMDIHAKTYTESQKIGNELTQAKSALFKTLVSPKSTKKEIYILKRKIVDLDKKRLETMFKAIEEVEKVFGKNEQTESVYKEFYHLESMGRDNF